MLLVLFCLFIMFVSLLVFVCFLFGFFGGRVDGKQLGKVQNTRGSRTYRGSKKYFAAISGWLHT